MSHTVRVITALFPLALAFGCGTQTNTNAEIAFQSDWAEAWCDRQASCATEDFDADWTDREECIAERSDDAKFSAYWGDLVCGKFNQEAADECIAAVDGDTCEEWANEDWRDACGDVYGC